MSKTVGVILALQDKCSPQLKKVADALGLTEKQAKKLYNNTVKLSKQMKNNLRNASIAVAAGLSAVAGASAVMVNHAMEAGDRIDKMSQKMQMSRQTFQELDYVFSQNGADISMMQTGMSKLAKAMEGAKNGTKGNVKTFKDLGISIKNSNGQLKSSEDVMFEAISKLQKMPDGAHKTALALQLFGKSATELQPLLNGNAKSVDELRKKYKDLGMGMTDEQINASVKFKETLDTIQRTFMGLGNQIGADLLPMLQQVADKLIENMPKIKATVTPILMGVINVSKFLFTSIVNISSAIISVSIAISNLWQKLEGLRAMLSAVWSIIKLVASVLWFVAKPALAFAGGVIKMLLIPLKVLVTTLSIVFQLVNKVAQAFGGWRTIGKAIKNVFDIGTNAINNTNIIPKHATGTQFAHGGLSLVGERGAELVDLPQGSKVYSNSDTQKMLSKDVVINVNIGGNLWGTQEFLNEMKLQLGRELRTVLNT